MRGFYIGLLISLICFSVQADAYQVFEENGKVGLKNEQGQVLIPASFQALGWTDGSFSVAGQVTGYKLGDSWGLINLKKEFITKASFESVTWPGGDRIIVSQKQELVASRFGCIDLTGKIVVPFRYDGIKIQGMRASVFVKNGARFEHGLIDLDDKPIIPLQFKNIYAIGSLRYAVENFDGKIALYSDQGTQLTDFVIDRISSFSKGLAIIHQDLKQGLIDFEGQIVIAPTYREIKIQVDGTVIARLFNEWKILDGANHEFEKMAADELSLLTGGLYTVAVSGKKGVVDNHLNFKIPPAFDNLLEYSGEKIIAKRNGKFGLIRFDQSQVFPFQFDSLTWDGTFVRGYVTSFGNQGWSLYDTFGVKKTSRLYDFMGKYNGKFFPVSSKGYRGAVNRYGEEFIHCVFDSLLEQMEGRMVVKFKGQFGIIDMAENWRAVPQPFSLQLINEEKYLERQPDMTFLKSYSGEVIYFTDNRLELKGDHLLEFLPDGSAKTVSLGGQLIDRFSFSAADEKVTTATEGLQGIKRDGQYGFVDDRGRLRVANRYENIREFNEGRAPVKILGKWGFVDTQDNIVIHPNFEGIEKFQNGTCIVMKSGKFGVIDKMGNVVLGYRYDDVTRTEFNTFTLLRNSKYGIAAGNGKVIVEPDFDLARDLGNGFILVSRAGKFGLITDEGVSTIPMIYDQLIYAPEQRQYLALKRAEWKPLNVK